MTALEQRSASDEWEQRKLKHEEEMRFAEENPEVPFTDNEIEKKIYRIVPLRFVNANKDQIDQKIWSSVQPFFNGAGLFLWGKPGTGKTHLCSAIIREYYYRNPKKRLWAGDDGKKDCAFYEPPPDPRMTTVPDLLNQIKASFGRPDATDAGWGEGIKEKEMSEAQIIKRYCEKEVLFLDDIGTEKTTDWAQQTIYTIIDHRYREMAQTVITSNLSLNELSDKTGDRITSRIAEMCRVIELKGKDRRVR